MRRTAALLTCVLALALALSATGCGDKTVTETGSNGQVTTRTVPNVHFAKTKFLLHSGLAFGSIRRWIYKPATTGAFQQGAPDRKKSIAKAAAAGVFALNELRLARKAALSDDKLRPLADKLSGLTDQIQSALTSFQGGKIPSTSKLLGIGAGLTSFAALAKTLGVKIPEQVPPSLGG